MKKALTVVCSLAALALAACSGSEQPPPPSGPPGPGPTGSGSDEQTDTNGLQGEAGQTGDNGDTNNEGQAGTTGVMGQPSTSMDDGAMGQPSTSMDMGGEIAVGEGNALVPNADFWVAGGTNAAGIQGAFYELSDADGGGGDTVIDSFTVDPTTGAVCISGTASQVLEGANGMPAYDVYWGGGIGLSLGDLGAMMGEVPWQRGEFSTFSYTLSGPDIPASLRFQVDYEGKGEGPTYCQNLGGTAGQHSSTLNATTDADGPVLSCWDPSLAAPIPADAGLLSIQWQVATDPAAPTTFDFCIENLSVQ